MRIEINFNLLIYNLNKEFPVLDFSCLNPSSVLGVLNLYCLYVYVHICMLKYCIACSSSSRFAASATRLNWYSSSWAIRKSFPSIKGMIGKDADYIEIKFSLVNLASVQYISQHTFIYIHTYIRAYKF